MQFNSRTVLHSILKQGVLLRFGPGTLFGSTGWHYAAVVNPDPLSDDLVIVGCVTSKAPRRAQIAQNSGFPPSTVVAFPIGMHPKFNSGTSGVDCNHVKKVKIDDLALLFDSGQIALVRNDGNLSLQYVELIVSGIKDSPLVSQQIKNVFL